MPKTSDAWTVLEHGPLEKLTENLWRVEGSVPRMPFKRVMTVARLMDGRLALHSAIALDEAAMKEVEAWGRPSFLVVPNGYHRKDAPAYKKRYPDIIVLAPRGSRAKVAEVVPVDGTYEDFPADERVKLSTLPGVGEVEGALLVRSNDGLNIVLNDVIFNMDERPKLIANLVVTLMGSAPGPRVSRLARFALVKDAKVLRGEFERLAALPDLERLIVSHEKIAVGRKAAAEVLHKAAAYL